MTKIFLPLLVAIGLNAFAQSPPQAINYQAIARNSTGTVLQNQPVNARFSIHDSTASGAIIYQETDTATTNQFGLFSTAIGNGTVVIGNFSAISWGGNAKFLEVDLDPTGGSHFSSMGTTQLLSVPYALFAGNVGTGIGSNAATLVYTTNGF